MKKDNITKEVMDKVVSYERKKSSVDVEVWGTGVLIMIGVLVYAVLEMIKQMVDTGTFDLLKIVWSDWEIARDLGDDLWEMIRSDFPWYNVLVVFVVFVFLLIFISLFIRKYFKAKKIWKQIKSFKMKEE
ncbi:MAG TPA: hypothetical protein VF837_05425 [Patescibacteria group bacterium]